MTDLSGSDQDQTDHDQPDHDQAGHDQNEDLANQYVGHRLRDRRKALGLSLQDVGALVGCRYQQVQKYEKGVNRISVGRLAAFAAALDVPTSYFLEGLDAALGRKNKNLKDQSQAGWVLDHETMAVAQTFSQIEDPVTRKKIVTAIEGHVNLENLAKALK